MTGAVSGETVLIILKGNTMNTSMLRSLTVLGLFASMGIASANAGESDKYGSAPASLDYPAATTVKKAPMGASGKTHRALVEMQREELYFLSVRNPFPKTPVAPIDPLSKKKVDGVHVGPAFKTRAYGSNFDYYRYVTFYEVDERKEVITSLPVIRQECHDRSDMFAGYSFTYSRAATLSASVSVEGLGLDTSMTATESQTVSRNFAPTKGIVADYTPYFVKQDQYGRTFIQTYNSKTGNIAFVTKEESGSAWWVHFYFPMMATRAYPYSFQALDAKWIFQVDRTIISKCEGEEEVASVDGPADASLSMVSRKRMKRGENQGERD
jgi:hypothetical protein